FIPKPHTPYQWNGMQTREYLKWAGQHMKQRCRIRAVKIKQHDIETSRLEGWRECFKPEVWWQAFADLGIDTAWYSHRTRPMTEVLPWDHVNVKKGRLYLEKEQQRSLVQLDV